MKEKEKKKLKCGSLPTADIVGAVGKTKSEKCLALCLKIPKENPAQNVNATNNVFLPIY